MTFYLAYSVRKTVKYRTVDSLFFLHDIHRQFTLNGVLSRGGFCRRGFCLYPVHDAVTCVLIDTYKMYEFFTVLLLLLPCNAMRCTVLVIVILSVCPSVCLSVTLVDCVHMVRPTIMISSPQGSPIILVSEDITLIPKFEGGHPKRGR